MPSPIKKKAAELAAFRNFSGHAGEYTTGITWGSRQKLRRTPFALNYLSMPTLNLKYGRFSLPLAYDEDRFEILGSESEIQPLSDIQISEKLDMPIDSKTIEEIVNTGETVLIVVPDATRQTACGQVINILVRRLIANGTTPFEISIIFATGIHRAVTEAEKQTILTPFIAQRIKTLAHGPRDITRIVRLGETSGVMRSGISVQLRATASQPSPFSFSVMAT